MAARGTGKRGSYAEILAVLVVTEWMYLCWATRSLKRSVRA
ncbi:hypothetical protein [Halomonas sp.]